MVDVDSNSEDSSGSEESDELEESDYEEEVTSNPERVHADQPNPRATTLLGNKLHIIENRCWEKNYLLRDY